MIYKYTYGNPIETDAVASPMLTTEGEPSCLVKEEGQFLYQMSSEDVVYGLGENMRGINKRGWEYISDCSDQPNHREDVRSLYAAHNFLVVDGKERFGIFVDYPGKVTFDVGYTRSSRLCITPGDWNLDLYVIDGESVKDIVRQFRRLVGRSYIPPLWAFGYGQSRWSYMNADEVREVVKEHRERGIPLDSVYLDIDYMERYKDFTVDREAFPDFPDFVREMKEQDIHLVPIIDAGVKIEEGYEVYEEGVSKGYFCKEENGKDFVAAVWPGKVHFPDMLNPEARKWFGEKYQVLLEQGIDGFWNDMNEPAIFYSENQMNEVLGQMDYFKGKNMDLQMFEEFKGLVSGLSNNPADYSSFYHQMPKGRVRHDQVHNLYGFNMTRAAGEAFEELQPDKRILMFSRSSCVGMHRYGGIWMGDNLSWWSHILQELQMLPALNMCGILYTGADIGGFGADATEDLVLRWLALGIFTPLMRNHSAMGTRRQEAYRFENIPAFQRMISLRYGLLPYLYSEYMKCALQDELYFKPLAFDYPQDSFAAQVEDQLLVGESIMIAPVYRQNAGGRYVYLPETMKMVKLKSMKERTEQILEQGHHYIEIGLDEVVIFIRPDHLVPVCMKKVSCTGQVELETKEVLGYVVREASYEQYLDDGYGKDYEDPSHYRILKLDAQGRLSVR